MSQEELLEISDEIVDRFVAGTDELRTQATELAKEAKLLRAETPPRRETAKQLHMHALRLFRELEHLLIETQIKQ